MSDEAATPRKPVRMTFESDGAGMRLTKFTDERGRETAYLHDDERGVVAALERDGSMTEYAVPSGWVLARTRHPESGAWIHVCLPAPSPPIDGPGTVSAWPTRLPSATAAGATAARRVAHVPAPPFDPGERLSVVTYSYSGTPRSLLPGEHITTFTYRRDDRMHEG